MFLVHISSENYYRFMAASGVSDDVATTVAEYRSLGETNGRNAKRKKKCIKYCTEQTEIDKRHKTAMMHMGQKCILYANETDERTNGRKTIKRMEHEMTLESLVVCLHCRRGKIAWIINWHIGVCECRALNERFQRCSHQHIIFYNDAYSESSQQENDKEKSCQANMIWTRLNDI